MRVSRLLSKTLREAPRTSEGGSQDLLVRAGFLRQLTTGVYSLLPLGQRVSQKIAQIVRERIEAVGAQEVCLPILQPRAFDGAQAEHEQLREESMDASLFHLRDRRERELVLAATHEVAAHQLVAEFARSYRDLPQLLYQIQPTFRDEPRPCGGLLRAREALTLELYSFAADNEGLKELDGTISQVFEQILAHLGVRYRAIAAQNDAQDKGEARELLALTDAGEDEALVCAACGYAANRECAEFACAEQERGPEGTLEEVYTPNCASISDLAAFLGVAAARTMKVVCYSASGRLVMALVRGDLEINEAKLKGALLRTGLGAVDLRLANAEELEQAGIVAGFTSPLGKDPRILLIADHSLQQGNNFVAGANKVDYHLKNVNYPRDFRVDHWDDLAQAFTGSNCARCGGPLQSEHGAVIAQLRAIGTSYAERFSTTFLDAVGEERPFFMGSYKLGIGSTLAALVEQSHDEKGLIWPASIAPYRVHLLGLDLDKGENRPIAERLYAELQAAGIEVLYDDRSESAGVKFNDADLLGLPLRLVVSKRSLKNGGAELKWRAESSSRIVPLEEVVQVVCAEGWRD